MKKPNSVFLMLALAVLCAALLAVPFAGGQRGGPAVPPATGPMLDIANKLADAINKQDAAAMQKMVAPDAVYLDEDGHAPPIARWIMNLTSGTPAKQIAISSTHGQMFTDTGWVSFNYTLNETFKGAPKAVKGTASIVVKKGAGGDWLIQMVHGSLEQKVAGLTQ